MQTSERPDTVAVSKLAGCQVPPLQPGFPSVCAPSPRDVQMLVECLEQEAALNDQLQRLRDKCTAEAGFRRHLEQQRARRAAEVRVLVEHLETCLQCIHNAISEYKQLDDKEAERQAEELALLTLLRQVQAK